MRRTLVFLAAALMASWAAAESLVWTDGNGIYTYSGAVRNYVAPTYGGTTNFSVTARDSGRSWISVASSADGMRLVATVIAGQLYTSTDAGVNWTARDSSRGWNYVASSADGTRLVATVSAGQIYTSTDAGTNWTARDSSRNWNGVASSADGTRLVATEMSGRIYTSTDAGTNWTPRGASIGWLGPSSSCDGTKLAVAGGDGYIYTSTDAGTNWTQQAGSGSRNWEDTASSSDGTMLVAAEEAGPIYLSTDSGVTWSPHASAREWRKICSSYDGTKLAAVDQGGKIYTSTDSGSTWAARDSDRQWRGIASSSDGVRIAATVASGGQIYTGGYDVTPHAPMALYSAPFWGYASVDSVAGVLTGLHWKVYNTASQGMEIVNYSTLTNWVLGRGYLTTNSSPTMAPGTDWTFALADVTNSAVAGTQIVNYQTMTNWVATNGYAKLVSVVVVTGNGSSYYAGFPDVLYSPNGIYLPTGGFPEYFRVDGWFQIHYDVGDDAWVCQRFSDGAQAWESPGPTLVDTYGAAGGNSYGTSYVATGNGLNLYGDEVVAKRYWGDAYGLTNYPILVGSSNVTVTQTSTGTVVTVDAGRSQGGLSLTNSYTLAIGADYTMVTNFYVVASNNVGAMTASNVTTSVAGYYDVSWFLSFAGAGGGETYWGAVFTNKAECPAFRQQKKTSGTDIDYFGGGQVIYLPAGCSVDLRVKEIAGASSMGVTNAQLKIVR